MSACFSSGEDILVSVWRVRRAGIEDRHAPVVLIVSSVWRKFAQRRRTARRSTAVAVDLPVFSSILIQLRALDGVDRLFGHDQAPSKMSHPATVSGNLLFFSTYASFLDRWIVQSPLFVSFLHTFSVEVAEQPPNKRRWNSSFLVNRWKLTPSFRCLSTLLPPKAQQKTVFSVAVQLGWPCHARCPLDRRAFERPWNCQDNKLVGRQTRRVDVFYRNLPHARNSESRFTPTCLPRSRFLCDRRPTSASGKGSLGSNVWYACYKQSTHQSTASRGVKKAKFNLLLDQLPRQNSSSNFYQTRVIRWR